VAIAEGFWEAKIWGVDCCYDQQVITERKKFHIQTKSGLLGVEGFLPSPPVIWLSSIRGS
jgi:hypothetical protein